MWIAERVGVSKGTECSSQAQGEDVVDLACWRAVLVAAKKLDGSRRVTDDVANKQEMIEAARACGAQDRRNGLLNTAPKTYTNVEQRAWEEGYRNETIVIQEQKEQQKAQRKESKKYQKALKTLKTRKAHDDQRARRSAYVVADEERRRALDVVVESNHLDEPM